MSMVDAALQLAGRGPEWPVFRLTGFKTPLRGTHGHKDATTDRATIEAMWCETPLANIGLATGAIVVIDLDGPGAVAEWLALAAGRAKPTLTVKTSRGYHLYYRAPEGAYIETTPGKRAQGGDDAIDVKAHKGYAVAPPSINRKTGLVYRWELDIPILVMPNWLVAWCLARKQPKPKREPPKPKDLDIGEPPAWLPRNTYRLSSKLENALQRAELPEFLQALKEIDAACAEPVWFRWGAAIHEFDPGPNGFAIFVAWSKTSKRHRNDDIEAACAKKWAQYERRDPSRDKVTRKSIYDEARKLRQARPLVVGSQAAPRAEPDPIATESGTNHPHFLDSPSVLEKVNGAHALPAALTVEQRPALKFIDFTEKGEPRPTTTNAAIAIQLLGIECRKDTFHEKMLVGGHAIEAWAGDLSDDAVHVLRRLIKRWYKFDPGGNNTRDAAIALCLERQFNPVVEYLAALKWDGGERIGRWVVDYLGAPDTPLNREVGRLMLVAAVRRARRPGTKFDQIIVLEGEEGTGKSSAVKILAGEENFSDQHILGASDKEQQEAATGVWMHEIAELAGMRRTDVERIKQFASRTEDRARPAYGRIRIDMKRRGIFVATTNERAYLKSETGNRRFWPIETGRIDMEGLERDRDQLWAEAARQEAAGCSITLDRALWKEAAAEQIKRLDDEPWQMQIMDYITSKKLDDVSLGEVLQSALRFEIREIGQIEQTRVARVLVRAGMKRYRASVGNPRPWRYRWDSGTSGPS